MKKYIPMDKFAMNWCFTDIPTTILDMLKPLSPNYSSYLWNKYISKRNRHLMLMSNDEWALCLKPSRYNWQNDWNLDKYEPFKTFLSQQVSYKKDDIIYLFWMKEHGLEMDWSFFIKYWFTFLYDDEGVLIINPTNLRSISFGPSGTVCFGDRRYI